MSDLRPEWEAHVARVVAQFDRELGLREACRPYVAQAASGDMSGIPRVVLDDFSDIPFLDDIVGVEHYQLRSLLRARQGDLCVATCPSVESYRRYNRDRLGLGYPAFVEAQPGDRPPIAVCHSAMEGRALAALVAFAESAKKVLVTPYMSIGASWELAAVLERRSGTPVTVLGPPPPVTAFANNKHDVTRFVDALVEPILGRTPTVPTRFSTTAAGVARDLRALGATHAAVALKLPRCASAMGNSVFSGDALKVLKEASPDEATAIVGSILEEKQWDGVDTVLSVAWLDTDCSPSTQCWIPPEGAGAPVVEGVYEQLLEGEEKVFLGSTPADIGVEHTQWIEQVSLLACRGYQTLGYVGRCSFDFIVHEGTPYLVECNGRWGGTSIPMHLMDRIFGRPRPPYRARDYVSSALAGMTFDDLSKAMGKSLYDAATGCGKFIVYNVGCLRPFGKFDVIALGATVEEANAALEEELPRTLQVTRLESTGE